MKGEGCSKMRAVELAWRTANPDWKRSEGSEDTLGILPVSYS